MLLTITCEPGRVTFCDWPWLVTVMLLPKMKFAVVRPCETLKIVMLPRMPMVPDGVVMVMGLVLLLGS